MKVRSNYPPYLEAVKRFLTELIPRVVDLQVTKVSANLGKSRPEFG